MTERHPQVGEAGTPSSADKKLADIRKVMDHSMDKPIGAVVLVRAILDDWDETLLADRNVLAKRWGFDEFDT